MKTIAKLFTITMAGLLIVACAGPEQKKDTSKEDVKKEIKEAAETTKVFIEGEFDELVNNFEEFATKSKEDIAGMRKKVENVEDEFKTKLEKKLNDIEQTSTQLSKKVDEYKDATDDKKDELKKEIKALKTALDESIKTFNAEMEKK